MAHQKSVFSRAIRCLWACITASAAIVALFTAPALAQDNAQNAYTYLDYYQNPDWQTCVGEAFLNGSAPSNNITEWHGLVYNWKPGDGGINLTCQSHSVNSSAYFVKSLKDYGYTGQHSIYGNSCICDANHNNCLKVKHSIRDLRGYGIRFASIGYKIGGCGGTVVNGRQAGYIYHVSRHCMQAQTDSFSNGVNIHLWDKCDLGTPRRNRIWYYEKSTKFIRNVDDSSWCLQMYDLKWNDGTNIVVKKCSDGPKETKTWNYTTGGGFSAFQATYNTNMCLDLDHNNSGNGTNIQLWGCNGSDAQKWRLAWN